MKNQDINSVYDAYKGLSRKQRQRLLSHLQSQGLGITHIETYTYSEAEGIRHLFFYFENQKKPVPYFLLEADVWEKFKEKVFEYKDIK